MTSKEALERLEKHCPTLYKEVSDSLTIIKQDLERLEGLEIAHKELIKYDMELFSTTFKFKKAIEILKDIFVIYAGDGKGYIDCCVENPVITFDLYNNTQFKEFHLLKEVMNNE